MATKKDKAMATVKERIGGDGGRAFITGVALGLDALGVCPLYLGGESGGVPARLRV